MERKISKKIKKKEELLPSFLSDLTAVPENVDVLSRPAKSVQHLGPVFFGCHQYHPPPHSLNLGNFHHTQYTVSSTESILHDMYIPKPAISKKCTETIKEFHPVIKHKKPFVDLYPHKCPGKRKVFFPEIAPKILNFGVTNSTIEGEMSMEIPLYRLRRKSSKTSTEEIEVIEPSDIWEERRINMSKKERMAHAHFPKQFVTVILIGPDIPEDLTITKLPSKRKSPSEFNINLKSKEDKMIEVTEEIIESATKQDEGNFENKATGNLSSTEVQKISSVKFTNDEESDLASEIEEEGFFQNSESVHSQRQMKEELENTESDEESLKSAKRENSEEENLMDKSQE